MRVARSTPPERVSDPNGVAWRGPLAILAALYAAAQVFFTIMTGSVLPAGGMALILIAPLILGPLGIIGVIASVILTALVFRAAGIVGWKSYVLAGGALGMLLICALDIGLSEPWRSRHHNFPWPMFIHLLSAVGLAGMAGALVFWIILRPDRMRPTATAALWTADRRGSNTSPS